MDLKLIRSSVKKNILGRQETDDGEFLFILAQEEIYILKIDAFGKHG